ncbi:hypothetical protein PR048_024941 [Dryococelus australis]|uniref:Reverse transcriptase n=1 Tax=Dryococelus australis TaxID=614101 RepID=A0ABQ9GPZ1_9NEOP|nr:hypothetical protein PR048_024941 [Dryococelus australis]
MQLHIERNNILLNEQFGFRRKHSRTQQLVRSLEHITLGFDHRKYTAAVFLDIEKAFDRIWHVGLHVYISDMPNTHGAQLACYADDTAIFSSPPPLCSSQNTNCTERFDTLDYNMAHLGKCVQIGDCGVCEAQNSSGLDHALDIGAPILYQN